MKHTAKANVFVYLALVFAFCTLTYLFHLGPLAAMWGPAVAAVIASLLRRRSLKEIGWKVGPPKWLAAGWAIPVLVALLVYGLIWMAGVGGVPNPTFLQRARFTLGMTSQSNGLVIVAAFLYITMLGLLPGMVAAVGEEIGWRGFLVPELAKWMTFPKTALASGAIWVAWHLPAILSGSYGSTDTPRWYQIGCFSAMVVSTAVISAWLRMKSGSIWPVTIMHATHNGVIQAFFDRITKNNGHTHYFSGEFGVGLALFFAALAFYCMTTRKRLTDGDNRTDGCPEDEIRERLHQCAGTLVVSRLGIVAVNGARGSDRLPLPQILPAPQFLVSFFLHHLRVIERRESRAMIASVEHPSLMCPSMQQSTRFVGSRRIRSLLPNSLLFVAVISLANLLRLLPVALAGPARSRMPDQSIRFEINRGQTDAQVKFLARFADATVFLTDSDAVLRMRRATLHMRTIGMKSSTTIAGERPRPEVIRYYRDGKMITAGTCEQVRYANVYPGVDLIYYGGANGLEYDFRLMPGVDPGLIRLRFDGADSVLASAEGDLVIHTSGGDVRQHRPVVYQEASGRRTLVDGRYSISRSGEVSFVIGHYDRTRPLVIDPVIQFSTYISGSNTDAVNDMKVDSNGYVYLTGSTTSPDFPVTNRSNPFQGQKDIFVTKLSPDGKSIVYSTFLGHSESSGDEGAALFVDDAGSVYVAAFVSKLLLLGDARYAVVAKLNPDGSLAFFNRISTTAGTANENPYDITVDSQKNIYVAGWTDTDTIPIVNGFNSTPNTLGSGFLVVLDPSAQNIRYSTYIGSVGMSRTNGVAVDSSGFTYVTGQTSQIPTTPGAFQTNLSGDVDAYVMKLDTRRAGAASIVYSTYIGGGELDAANAIRVDAQGRAWIAGETKSNNASMTPVEFPVTTNAFQKHLGWTLAPTAYCNGSAQVDYCPDAFVAGLSSDGKSLVYSSYLGGDGPDLAQGLAIDPATGRIYITGQACNFFPVTSDATQPSSKTCTSAYLAVFDPSQAGQQSLVFSTFLSGSGNDKGTAVGVGPSGAVWVAGAATSTDFPLVSPLMSVGGGNASSVFVTRYQFSATGAPQISTIENAALGPAAITAGSFIAIKGSNLWDASRSASNTGYDLATTAQLPAAMDGVTVSFDVPSAALSVPGHLLYVSATQVNVLVPWELSGQVSAQVAVKVGNSSSNAIAMAMSTYAPSMFQYPYNSGRAAATSTANPADPIVTPTNPVPRGAAVTLYLTGMGPVNNRPASGAPSDATGHVLSTTTAQPGVTIAGQTAQVLYSGLVPGNSGLYQLNVTVPPNIAAGDQPVVVSIGGVASAPAIISVR